jgi:class 3 adenylate cyclase
MNATVQTPMFEVGVRFLCHAAGVSGDQAVPSSGVVTLLFTDVEGSTSRWEADPDEMRVALAARMTRCCAGRSRRKGARPVLSGATEDMVVDRLLRSGGG